MTASGVDGQRRVSGFAIATLVLGVVGGILPAVICGMIALGQIRNGSRSGMGLVVSGLIVSAVWTLVFVAAIVYTVTSD